MGNDGAQGKGGREILETEMGVWDIAEATAVQLFFRGFEVWLREAWYWQ